MVKFNGDVFHRPLNLQCFGDCVQHSNVLITCINFGSNPIHESVYFLVFQFTFACRINYFPLFQPKDVQTTLVQLAV